MAVNESVPGTEGYLAAIERFSAASLNLAFAEINQDFLPFMPAAPARVLDLGAGVGQNAAAEEFELILLDGVWHRLAPEQRPKCIKRFSQLLKPSGICAVSLRNGPPGVGTHVFETCSEELCKLAKLAGFELVLRLDNQASKMVGKSQVYWSRVLLAKS